MQNLLQKLLQKLCKKFEKINDDMIYYFVTVTVSERQ